MKMWWGGARAFGLWMPAICLVVLFSSVPAMAAPKPAAGDEDPFPLRCVDFSGKWRGDSGTRYTIGQRKCDYLQIAMSFGSEQVSLTIVPDNQLRTMPGSGGMVRHRWNSPKMGSILEAHLSYLDGNAHITEVVTYEKATPNLMLETTYRTIECPGSSKPRHETEQETFRRINDAGQVMNPGPIGQSSPDIGPSVPSGYVFSGPMGRMESNAL